MSYPKISAAELHHLASDSSNVKLYAMINKHYNDILNAAKDGKYEIMFYLDGKFGDLTADSHVILDTLEDCFPGVKIEYDNTRYNKQFIACKFSW